jgi:hypothetical protein
MGFQGSYYPLPGVNTSRIFRSFPLDGRTYQPRTNKNENNIPRIMGSLALAPYPELSRAICLALVCATHFV